MHGGFLEFLGVFETNDILWVCLPGKNIPHGERIFLRSDTKSDEFKDWILAVAEKFKNHKEEPVEKDISIFSA
jgi:hypothetical protein